MFSVSRSFVIKPLGNGMVRTGLVTKRPDTIFTPFLKAELEDESSVPAWYVPIEHLNKHLYWLSICINRSNYKSVLINDYFTVLAAVT